MRVLRVLACVWLMCTVGSCQLTEVTLVDSQDVVIAEVYVQMDPGTTRGNRVTAFLHRTLATEDPVSRPVPGAAIKITRSDGLTLELARTSLDACVTSTPVGGTGTCYWAPPELASRLSAGDSLDLMVRLPDGGELRSAMVLPGDFTLLVAATGGACTVEPDTQLEVVWTVAHGAWAYVNETEISGLRAALEPQGLTVEKDTLDLLGLSVAATDTTVIFPREFGIFARFDLDQGVALALQKGLPDRTTARVTITAGERNYINWVRGGNFNPSGAVRVPSIRGDGSGVFAGTVSRSFRIYSTAIGLGGAARCGIR